MDLYSEIKKLEGMTLKTLRDNKSFDVIDVTRKKVIIEPHESEKERPINWSEIDGAYRQLAANRRITRGEIEERHSPRNPAYVAAMLAELPGVRVTVKPVITLHLRAD